MEQKLNNNIMDSDLASLKPFRLVKFFSFTGLGVVLVTTLVLSWVISNYAQKVLLERSEGYALILAENLNNQVFLQFVVPIALQGGEIALRNPQQFNQLNTIVHNITHGLKVDAVTIYDSRENVISYSTISSLVGKRDRGGVQYQKALEGIDSMKLESNGSLLSLFPGSSPISRKLTTFIPFRPEKQPKQDNQIIMGVTEIVLDLSDDLKAIIRMQGTIIIISVLIMGALFAVLGFIVARADRIIEERAEERRKLEIKLHQNERLASLGKMVAAVSHEIKNPLGIISSTGEILRKRLKDLSPENDHLAEIIIAETVRLDGIVMEFLDFARPQSPNLSKTNINDILLKVLHFMDPEFQKWHITQDLNLDTSLPLATVDSNLLYRVFLNLLINAVQAMPKGGVLAVGTKKASSLESSIHIRIADTGIGISKEKLERIFQPFFTDKNRGTGLGLAIAKNIIDSHNGIIEVESEEDKGTAFNITLPFQIK